jgi:hypothetical protein
VTERCEHLGEQHARVLVVVDRVRPPSLALWLLSSAVSETLRSVTASSSWFFRTAKLTDAVRDLAALDLGPVVVGFLNETSSPGALTISS